MRNALLLAMLAWCGTGSAAAQTPVPPRDPRPAAVPPQVPAGTASVFGSVVVTGSGQPARKARVQLTGGEPRVSLSRTTDSRGAFSFTALPAGRYSLSVSKPGHVTASFGQQRPGRPGTSIQLADGQHFEARVQLPKGGALTGVIVDENAEPSQGVQVRALRYVYQNGVRTLQSSGNGATDDRGIYRIFGLQPGDYVVCATPRNQMASDYERLSVEMEAISRAAEAAAQRDANEARVMLERAATMRAQVAGQPEEAQTGYAAICFPSATSPSAATTVTLGAGEERAGVDFQLQLIPLGRVEGTVITATGNMQGVQVTMTPAGEVSSGETRSARVDADGRFRFTGVVPGQYTIFARANTGGRPTPASSAVVMQGKIEAAVADRVTFVSSRDREEAQRYWAMTDVVVDGRSPANVVLTMQPALTIAGQVAFAGTSQQPPSDLTRIRVTAMAQGGPGVPRELASAYSGRVDAQGRFTISGLLPAQYRLSSGATGWYLESATIAGQDALDFAVDVRPGQNLTGATLTFTDQQTEFTGRTIDERNQPVSDFTIVVFSADPRYWTGPSRRIQTARPASDGRFQLRGLPPGDYRLATVFDPEPGSWNDPAFLQQLQSSATDVRLTPGEKKNQDIRIPSR